MLLRWFTHEQADDAERLVFYEKCMIIIVIIITPNGDWNYGYILTTYHLHKQYLKCGLLKIFNLKIITHANSCYSKVKSYRESSFISSCLYLYSKTIAPIHMYCRSLMWSHNPYYSILDLCLPILISKVSKSVVFI